MSLAQIRNCFLALGAAVLLLVLLKVVRFSYPIPGYVNRGTLQVRVTDQQSSAPIVRAKVCMHRSYDDGQSLARSQYASENSAQRSDQLGQVNLDSVILASNIGGQSAGSLSVVAEGYIPFQIALGPVLSGAPIAVTLKRKVGAPRLEQGRFSDLKYSDDPRVENATAKFGYSFTTGKYSSDLSDADFVEVYRLFADEPTARPMLAQSSVRSSYRIVPVNKHHAGSTKGQPVKFLWSLEAPPGGEIAIVPVRQRYAFEEIDECDFSEHLTTVSLFTKNPEIRSDIFCVRTGRGTVSKFQYGEYWVRQSNGTNKVSSALDQKQFWTYPGCNLNE